MKEIQAKNLRVGDIFYFDDSYRVVLSGTRATVRGVKHIPNKCITGPTPSEYDKSANLAIDIGTVTWIAEYFKVKLLVSGGEEV